MAAGAKRETTRERRNCVLACLIMALVVAAVVFVCEFEWGGRAPTLRPAPNWGRLGNHTVYEPWPPTCLGLTPLPTRATMPPATVGTVAPPWYVFDFRKENRMPKVNLARVPLETLQREIQRRREELPKLVAQRDELNRRIAELEGPIASKRPAKKAKRAVARKRRVKREPRKGKLTLNDALAHVLKGKKGVSVAEAAQGVLALGYKSRAKDTKLLVNQALYKSDRFKRVGKGVYALKA